MSKDIIIERILQVLDNLESCGLEDHEKEKLAHIVSNVVRSDEKTRAFFFTETLKVIKELNLRMEKSKRELLNELMEIAKTNSLTKKKVIN